MTASLSTAPDGTRYRDLNRNGVMDPYEDPRLPIAERVADLVSRLSLEEKAGLMIQTIVSTTTDGEVDGPAFMPGRTTAREFVEGSHITHLNIHQIPDPRAMARWVNALQRVAAASGHGIPVTISTDPRHSFTENWGASFTAGHLSAWPEPLGLGAIADPGVVREFADIARREYTAVGIRSALHPTLDVATEPRWARQYSTFGQDADLVGRLGVAYLDGFEGDRLTSASVACMAKHFPGGGPEKDGEDPHFPYGTDQVYPGGMFEYHLEPFRRVIERGVSAIMPSYGVPRGLVLDGERVEEVGFGFNHQIITGLLREKLGFDGVVCTDWGLVTESRMMGKVLPPRSWGVEHLSEIERFRKALDAGCDQFGGEDDPALLIELVRSGAVPESRLDVSVARLLRVKFELGLFDDPFVDEDAAAEVVGSAEFRAIGTQAQSRSTVILPGGSGDAASVLPLRPGTAVHAPDISDEALREAGLEPVAEPADADVAILRLAPPFEPRDHFMLESSFHAGSLAFDDEVVATVAEVAAAAPTVVTVHLERPLLLAPLLPHAHAVVATFGASEGAILDALTGRVPAEGRLPFEIPRSTEAVLAGHSDVPGGTADPVFEGGRATLEVRADA
ncbi:glycoside hydrolase family 3 N-terminal domain-containing protein [Microbacterium sp. MM2322]|uniref:glycoside hydrolase family 3 protein n=1 Tax=Microbacterium sp. MM2322 TaxID=3157631 RepID=UPI0032D5A0DA